MSNRNYQRCPNCGITARDARMDVHVCECPACSKLFCVRCMGTVGGIFDAENVCPHCSVRCVAVEHVVGKVVR